MILQFVAWQTVCCVDVVQFSKNSKYTTQSCYQSTEARPSFWQHLRAHEQNHW